MPIPRPDLSAVDPAVRAYIEALEAELDRRHSPPDLPPEPAIPLEPSEPPTTLNLITISQAGLAKRTPRHLYTRQRRSGMGIFDLELPEADAPQIIVTAEPGQHLLLFTNLARTFRLPVSQIAEAPVHSKGQPITGRLGLLDDERIVAALPDQPSGAVTLLSQRGFVRRLRHHVFGEYMKPGASMFEVRQSGPLVAACRTRGEDDLLLVSRQGRAVRFAEKLIPPPGGPGFRLESGDAAIAVTAVEPEGGVFLIDAEGNGTIRLMSGFNPNKSAGGSGKIAMHTDCLIGAQAIGASDDIFLISRLAKIIRFMAAEVPAKEGPVQGVICMTLRADQVTALATASLPTG